jgi:hydroxyacylglutathione hydrolase
MIEGMHHNVQIIPIPAFKDNYIWLIHNGQQALAVDPGDAYPVIETLKQLNLRLSGILITHHHQDHIAGVAELLEAYPEVDIYAPKLETFSFSHIAVDDNQVIQPAGLNLNFSVMHLPGHTLGHVAYYAETTLGDKWLFCGDTLFGAGCGRIFEGTPAQMHHSLQRLAGLAGNTQVYCSHEYTLRNIEFALSVEPNNLLLQKRKLATLALRDKGIASLPSSIELERETNPFLRCHVASLQAYDGLIRKDEVAVFSKIRELRNLY